MIFVSISTQFPFYSSSLIIRLIKSPTKTTFRHLNEQRIIEFAIFKINFISDLFSLSFHFIDFVSVESIWIAIINNVNRISVWLIVNAYPWCELAHSQINQLPTESKIPFLYMWPSVNHLEFWKMNLQKTKFRIEMFSYKTKQMVGWWLLIYK